MHIICSCIDIGDIGRRKPFSVHNTFSFLQPATATRTCWPLQGSDASQHPLRRYSPQVSKSNSSPPPPAARNQVPGQPSGLIKWD